MIYRRFGYIQSRLLLDKQNELQNLEMDLEEMDKEDSKQRHDFLKTAEIDTEDPTERKKFMMALERKFNEYGKSSRKHFVSEPRSCTMQSSYLACLCKGANLHRAPICPRLQELQKLLL